MRAATILAVAAMLSLAGCAASVAPPSVAPVDRTTEEALLLAGARLDLQATCAPLRADLAESALAGVVCEPESDVVDRASIYLFNSEHDLLTAYLARLAAHNVPPRTNGGRCVLGQGSDGSYVPGDSGPNLAPARGGCYVDSAGRAHYLATLPPFVLIQIDGIVGDSDAVERFAWLGNQDQPGAPTIWRSTGPASPEK